MLFIWRSVYLLFSFIIIFSIFCREKKNINQNTNSSTIDVEFDLKIGSNDQPLEYLLGRPLSVRTDTFGRIYIADQASLNIKIFDENGTFLKNIAGRGRGPGELQNIELMDFNSEGNIIVMDRGKLKYIVIDTNGEEIAAYDYNLTNQFYPTKIFYLDDQILSLFFSLSSSDETPELEREAFHVYTTDFQRKIYSFFPIGNVGIHDMLHYAFNGLHRGSFTIDKNKNAFYYSPGTYTGELYKFIKTNNGIWQFDHAFNGKKPNIEPYEIYPSESYYKKALENNIARASKISYGGELFLGRQLSIDSGIYQINDGRIVHFYSEWKEGYLGSGEEHSNRHPMDMYVQIFDQDGILLVNSFLFQYVERYRSARIPNINWKDSKDRFYLIEYPEDIPIVRRFKLKNLEN